MRPLKTKQTYIQMKKVLSILMAAGVITLVACGPSAEDKAAAEKAMQDSIDQAVNASGTMQEAAAMQDSANAMMDTVAKMAADTMPK